jgi:hypothetical protein
MTGKYTGWDGDAAGKRPGTEKLVQLLVQRYGFRNLGTWGPRKMRGSDRPSVHGTGRAADLGWTNPANAAQVALWLVNNFPYLEELHDYAGTTKKGTETWGRGYRIGRGFKDYTATDNAGTPGPSSRWYHLEVSPAVCDDPQAIVKHWKTVTKLDLRVD